jgi:uncharacterized protein (DUF1697 family)
MATHAAFLRGINLGRNRRVKNEALRAALEGAGFESVATFRASGNVVFRAPHADDLAARAETALREALGFEVAVFLRSARQVKGIAGFAPFEKQQVGVSEGKLQVALLAGTPGASARKAALAMASKEDALALRGNELYWLPRGRMADSELDLKVLESLVGPWTMRTKATIEQIAEKHLG